MVKSIRLGTEWRKSEFCVLANVRSTMMPTRLSPSWLQTL